MQYLKSVRIIMLMVNLSVILVLKYIVESCSDGVTISES